MSQPSAERVPKQMQPKFEEIVSLTDNFCQEHLNDEYAQLTVPPTHGSTLSETSFPLSNRQG